MREKWNLRAVKTHNRYRPLRIAQHVGGAGRTRQLLVAPKRRRVDWWRERVTRPTRGRLFRYIQTRLVASRAAAVHLDVLIVYAYRLVYCFPTIIHPNVLLLLWLDKYVNWIRREKRRGEERRKGEERAMEMSEWKWKWERRSVRGKRRGDLRRLRRRRSIARWRLSGARRLRLLLRDRVLLVVEEREVRGWRAAAALFGRAAGRGASGELLADNRGWGISRGYVSWLEFAQHNNS